MGAPDAIVVVVVVAVVVVICCLALEATVLVCLDGEMALSMAWRRRLGVI